MASPDGATRPSFNADQPDSQSRLLQPDSTLTVGQSITLTLGSDALVITGEHCLTIHACRSWLHIAHSNQLLVLLQTIAPRENRTAAAADYCQSRVGFSITSFFYLLDFYRVSRVPIGTCCSCDLNQAYFKAN
jgi:hypothetical protein